jgi:uncharacterized membrane protein YeaQ/YmgE (transglycosylase-associated protein family)
MSFLEISLTNFFVWSLIGVGAGYYLSWHDNRRVSGGVTGTSIFAVMGALSAGYLGSFLLGKAMRGLSIEGLFFALLGALVLALFYRFSFNDSHYVN